MWWKGAQSCACVLPVVPSYCPTDGTHRRTVSSRGDGSGGLFFYVYCSLVHATVHGLLSSLNITFCVQTMLINSTDTRFMSPVSVTVFLGITLPFVLHHGQNAPNSVRRIIYQGIAQSVPNAVGG